MKIKIRILVITVSMSLMVSCVSQKTLYNWGTTQETSYQYIKRNTDQDLEKLMRAYQYVIDNQKAGRMTVPPGIYADYGFFLIKQGKTEEGLKLMKMEVALYPESAVFIERIIKRIEEK